MIVTGMITHNERNRFLKDVLESIIKFSDFIVIIDDGSKDGTSMEVKDWFRKLRFQNYELIENKENLFALDESILRNRLWFKCKSKCNDENDWIFIFDADEIVDQGSPNLMKELLNSQSKLGANTACFRLFDMWNTKQYRDDNLWNAHYRYIPFGVRWTPGGECIPHNKLHCGRFPIDKRYVGCTVSGITIRHMGWSKAEDRKRKYKRYLELDPIGTYGSTLQYESILDKKPNLEEYDLKKIWRMI